MHHYRDHSHGHPEQTSIHQYLKEPIERLERWAKNTHEGRETIEAAQDHYERLAEAKVREASEDYRQMVATGIRYSSPRHETCEIIAQTYQTKDVRKTVLQLLALGIMLEETPQSFKSDRAFLYQTTQVYMRGSTARAQYRFRRYEGRRVAVTRYLKRKTRTELGNWLTREIVYFGVLIYRQWMKTKREDKEQRDKVIAAIRASTDHPIMNV
jgi:hypothetical protein